MAATTDEEFDFTKKAEYSAKVFNASMVQVMYYIEWMVFVLWSYMVVIVEKVLCISLKLCGMVNPYPWINAHIRFRSYFHCDTEALLSGS